MATRPDIAMIVATYNRAVPLDRFLRNLRAQTLPRDQWELWIAVDGSSDETMAMLAAWKATDQLPLHFFYQENAGQAKARHEAILRAQAPRIVVVDDDMEVCPGFLREHVRRGREAGDKSIVIGKIVSAEGWHKKPLYSAVGEDTMAESHRLFESGIAPNANALAANVSMQRDLYLAAGGYDFSLRVDEDRELGFRLERLGSRFVFSADAWAVHLSNVGSFAKWARRQHEYGRTACRIWETYGRDPLAHPLRNYINGHPLKRWVVQKCVPSDALVALACGLLRVGGNLLQKAHLYRLAIATHKLLAALRYHQGARDYFGSWQHFTREVAALEAHADRPLDPTSRGLTSSL